MAANEPSNLSSSAVAVAEQRTIATAPAASPGLRGIRGLLTRPEMVTVVLLILAFIAGAVLSPYFLDIPFLLDYTSTYIEIGIMALGMVFVIISCATVDLSVASNLALTACVVGILYFDFGVPMEITIVLALLLGAGLGFLNGTLITRLKLPALAVTLATLALYRGVANILVGDDSRPMLAWSRDIVFPDWFVGIDRIMIPGTPIPLPLVLLVVLAILLGLVLHKTTFGRWVYAIGTNEEAARYSGIPTDWLKRVIFTLSGFVSGLAGLVMVSRLGVARYDHARGWELDVITAVVLGGVSINGGRGSMFGAVIAFLLIVILRTGMGVANIKAESQLTAIGALLVISVIVSNLSARFRK
jgi:rhamnose transport system permease protein